MQGGEKRSMEETRGRYSVTDDIQGGNEKGEQRTRLISGSKRRDEREKWGKISVSDTSTPDEEVAVVQTYLKNRGSH